MNTAASKDFLEIGFEESNVRSASVRSTFFHENPKFIRIIIMRQAVSGIWSERHGWKSSWKRKERLKWVPLAEASLPQPLARAARGRRSLAGIVLYYVPGCGLLPPSPRWTVALPAALPPPPSPTPWHAKSIYYLIYINIGKRTAAKSHFLKWLRRRTAWKNIQTEGPTRRKIVAGKSRPGKRPEGKGCVVARAVYLVLPTVKYWWVGERNVNADR